MDKRLKQFRPAVMRMLGERYGAAEAERRWKRIEELYGRWLREDGDLGGRANALADNMTLCYAVCAFYEAMDRQLTRAEFDRLVEDVMREPFKATPHRTAARQAMPFPPSEPADFLTCNQQACEICRHI